MGNFESGWLVVLVEAEGLRWVLRNRQMAFTSRLMSRARGIGVSDSLIIYVGKGAYGTPGRDVPQLQALARVTGPVEELKPAINLLGIELVAACGLDFELILPERGGVPFQPLVPKLEFIKKKEIWGQYVRQGLIKLPENDLRLILTALKEHAEVSS